MWQIINVEPTYGVCSICRSHECGIVDGKHQWIHTEALDDTRENIVIGYKCVQLFAANLGISKEVVEKIVHAPLTDEQILRAIKNGLELKFDEPNSHDNLVPVGATSEHYEESKGKVTHRGRSTPKK